MAWNSMEAEETTALDKYNIWTNEILIDCPINFSHIFNKKTSVCKILQVSVWANNYEMASKEAEKYSEMRELGDWLKTNTPPASNQSLGNKVSFIQRCPLFRGNTLMY